MAETMTAPPPATTQPASAAPASPSPQPAGSATASPRVKPGAEEAFGYYAGLDTPEPVVDSSSEAETPQTPGPEQSGHPDDTQGTVGAETGKTQSAGLPGDEYLKEFETIDGSKSTPAQPLQETSDTPPDIEKITNPDGKVGATDFETRLKNAQSYIGRQHSEYGQKLKTANTQLGQLIQSHQTMKEMFAYDQSGKLVGAKPEAVMQLFDLADPAAMEAMIDARGYQLVPKGVELKSGVDPMQAAWEKQYVDSVIPGDELTTEEKLEQIQSDAKLNRAMTLAESRFVGLREQQQAAYRDRVQTEGNQKNQRAQALLNSFMAGLKDHPDFRDVYLPAFNKYNQLLGPTAANGKALEGALSGEKRLGVIRKLMEFDRFPKILKDVQTKSFAAGQKDAWGKRSMGAIPSSGEAPSVEAGELKPEGSKIKTEAEAVFGARSGAIGGA